jgi:hypothetical protein
MSAPLAHEEEWRRVEDEEWRLASEPRIHPHAHEVAACEANPNTIPWSELACDLCGGPAFVAPDYTVHALDGRLYCDRCWRVRKESAA